jgi:hypothetical protein
MYCYTVTKEMQSESSKPHSFLSDNSQRLARFAQDVKRAPSVRNIVILLSALLVISAVVSGIWITIAKKTEKPYATSVVQERDFSFQVDFYKKAAPQTSREKTYLVASDAKGYKTAIWVAKMDSTLDCGRSPSFAYDAPVGMVVHASCYEEDRLTFASDVIVNEQVYQINMTSEKPMSVIEAKKIFGSVIIEE